jgi:hypothetical protein
MDFNEYAIEREVRERLEHARAVARAAASRRALRSSRGRRRVRAALGAALIELGQWLRGAAPTADGTRA